VSDPGDVLLGRAELEQAFTALGERLARRGVVADVFVIGGAARAGALAAVRYCVSELVGAFLQQVPDSRPRRHVIEA